MTLDLEVLDRTPAESARVLALALLADATDAAVRLDDRSDEEALHDFRVALRRLRSTLRAWRPALGDALRKKDEPRLRRITRDTNEARDAEVLLRWVASLRDGFLESHRPAAEWLCSRLDRRRRHSRERLQPSATHRLERVSAKLGRRLASAAVPPALAGATFGSALATLVRAQARALREELTRISSAEAVAHAHRARIEGKRLRYLLEPLRGTPRVDSAGALQGLKGLQDLLGELHDAHVAAAEVAAARVEAAAEHLRHRSPQDGPGLRPGLLAIERAAHERARRAFDRLESEVLERKAVHILDPVYAVAVALEERAGPGDGPLPAPRRRLLLAELPDPARWGSATEIEKGWLPGDRPRECFGVARSPEGESFFRAIFAGVTGRRAQSTEEVSRAVFESFWPLTEGRRVHKRCHVAPGEPGWRFDEYLDRQLALAVAEPANEGPPPAWLEPYVVRDVTGERGYHDDVLARRPPRTKKPRPESASAPAPRAPPAGDAAGGAVGPSH
jgi:CHAD domain-containing protein